MIYYVIAGMMLFLVILIAILIAIGCAEEDYGE